MNFLSHVVQTKGILHSLTRSAQIIRRYSMGEKRFSEMMSGLTEDYTASGIKVTFCVTASLLDDHSDFLKSFNGCGYEFAAHGYVHTNMKKKSRNEQFDLVRKSLKNFERFDIPVYGFRCPYLSYNKHTIEALTESPFSWVSNNVIFWEEMNRGRHVERHLKKLGLLYNVGKSENLMSLPSFVGNLVDIPITAPDDEMIYERCGIRERKDITRIWLKTLTKVHERGELFHLLFHPERFLYIRESIRDVVAHAGMTAQPVWFATLHDIAAWHRKMRKTRWSAAKNSSGGASVFIAAPPEATILVKSEKTEANKAFYRDYALIRPEAKDGGFCLKVDELESHIIGLAPNVPEPLEEVLVNEGFLVERSEFKGTGMHLQWDGEFRETDRLALSEKIDSSPYPLIRVWRWPNGCRSAFTVSSDVDSINLADFVRRLIHF